MKLLKEFINEIIKSPDIGDNVVYGLKTNKGLKTKTAKIKKISGDKIYLDSTAILYKDDQIPVYSTIKHHHDFYIKEDISIPVKVGDTILTGKFRNKKIVVKSIGKDERGLPTINGKTIVNFRILKEDFTNSDNLDKMIKFLNKRNYNFQLTDNGIKVDFSNQWEGDMTAHGLKYSHKTGCIYDPSIAAIDLYSGG